ncbi:hypothetical protein P7C70_g6070, partial [Phenoliferia sp. Uapishka_3]
MAAAKTRSAPTLSPPQPYRGKAHDAENDGRRITLQNGARISMEVARLFGNFACHELRYGPPTVRLNQPRPPRGEWVATSETDTVALSTATAPKKALATNLVKLLTARDLDIKNPGLWDRFRVSTTGRSVACDIVGGPPLPPIDTVRSPPSPSPLHPQSMPLPPHPSENDGKRITLESGTRISLEQAWRFAIFCSTEKDEDPPIITSTQPRPGAWDVSITNEDGRLLGLGSAPKKTTATSIAKLNAARELDLMHRELWNHFLESREGPAGSSRAANGSRSTQAPPLVDVRIPFSRACDQCRMTCAGPASRTPSLSTRTTVLSRSILRTTSISLAHAASLQLIGKFDIKELLVTLALKTTSTVPDTVAFHLSRFISLWDAC